MRELKGLSVLQLFGGAAKFGLRLDMDPITNPDVIGDAWLPPFAKNSFQAVILDPPYVNFGRHCREALGRSAAWLATEYVVWFSAYGATSLPGCSIVKWWTVIVGNDCLLRNLVFFRPRENKPAPWKHFTRGSAIRYNRWIAQPQGLPFGEIIQP